MMIALVPFALFAATEEDLRAFEEAMIKRDCHFDLTSQSQELQNELGWSDAKLSDVIMRMTLDGEFTCPSGCVLINDACPD